MAESRTHTETWQAGEPQTVGAATWVPIARTVLHAAGGAGIAWLSACKAPLAIVVRGGDGLHAIGITDEPVRLDMLREKIADLDRLLALNAADPRAE